MTTATLPADGLYLDTPMSEYRSWPAWGSSDLKAMRLGPPALVPWRRENPSADTDATILGTAAHCAILEPARFASLYAHKPEGMSFASKEGKAWRDDPCRAGATILSHDQFVSVEQIVAAFHGKRPCADALSACYATEGSVLWTCPITGERLKARPDWWVEGEFVYDLKVSRHAAEHSVAFRAFVEGWMHQVAHYRAGLEAVGQGVRGARLVVIGPKPPQALRVYCVEVKEAALDILGLENENTVKRLAECSASGDWPSTPDEWTKIEPPALAMDSIVGMADLEEV